MAAVEIVAFFASRTIRLDVDRYELLLNLRKNPRIRNPFCIQLLARCFRSLRTWFRRKTKVSEVTSVG